MSDLIDREALLRQIDIDSEGEPGYYGDTWKFIDTIKSMPPAELSTNLASLGTDLISRQTAIRAIEEEWDGCCSEYPATQIIYDTTEAIERLSAIQPKRGKWVLVCDNNGMHFICNKCGAWRYHQEQKFCGECGADMREVNNESN